MKHVKSISEESLKLAEILKSKDQTEQKLKHYKDLLLNSQKIHESIQKRIEAGKTSSKLWIFGILPVFKSSVLDDLDIAKLEKELIEIEDTVFNQQQYYEAWMSRKRDNDAKVDEITRECNQNFDEVLEKAKKITSNPRLVSELANYKNDNNDQRIKMEFYLFLKQEINNNEVYNKNRR